VTPKDKLEGREVMIFADRKRKLAEARKRRSLAAKQAEAKAFDNRQPMSEKTAVSCAV